MAGSLQIRIRAICPFDGLPPQQHGGEAWAADRLVAYEGLVIVAAFVNSAEHVQRLETLGSGRARLIVLGVSALVPFPRFPPAVDLLSRLLPVSPSSALRPRVH